MTMPNQITGANSRAATLRLMADERFQITEDRPGPGGSVAVAQFCRSTER